MIALCDFETDWDLPGCSGACSGEVIVVRDEASREPMHLVSCVFITHCDTVAVSCIFAMRSYSWPFRDACAHAMLTGEPFGSANFLVKGLMRTGSPPPLLGADTRPVAFVCLGCSSWCPRFFFFGHCSSQTPSLSFFWVFF